MLLAGKRLSEISKQTGLSLPKLSIMRKRIKDNAAIKSIDNTKQVNYRLDNQHDKRTI